MMVPTFDDLIPALNFDDLIPEPQAGAPQYGAVNFDDLIPNQSAPWPPSFSSGGAFYSGQNIGNAISGQAMQQSQSSGLGEQWGANYAADHPVGSVVEPQVSSDIRAASYYVNAAAGAGLSPQDEAYVHSLGNIYGSGSLAVVGGAWNAPYGSRITTWGNPGPATPSGAVPTPQAEIYTVVPYDTLSDIADGNFAQIAAIVAANNLKRASDGSPIITPGQTLVIPDLSGADATTLTALDAAGRNLVAHNQQGIYAYHARQAARVQQNPLELSPEDFVSGFSWGPGAQVSPPEAEQSHPSIKNGISKLFYQQALVEALGKYNRNLPQVASLASQLAGTGYYANWYDGVPTHSPSPNLGTRLGGGARLAGSLFEGLGGLGLLAGGGATSETGVGILPAIAGWAMLGNAVDNGAAGLNESWTGLPKHTLLYDGVHAATGSPGWASAADTSASLLGGFGGNLFAPGLSAGLYAPASLISEGSGTANGLIGEVHSYLDLPSKLPADFDMNLPIGRFLWSRDVMPGTTLGGQYAHEQIGGLFAREAPEDASLTLNTAPGARGVDIIVPAKSVSDVGFPFGEIKPNSLYGMRNFNAQVAKWRLSDHIQAITYDKYGNIYLGFPKVQ